MFNDDDGEANTKVISLRGLATVAVALLVITALIIATTRYARARRLGTRPVATQAALPPNTIIGLTGHADADNGLTQRPAETEMRPTMYSGAVSIGRSVLKLPAGDCLLQHFGESYVPLHDIASMRGTDFAEFYYEENSAWFAGFPMQSSAGFNCCAYAVAPYLKLTPQDFLDGHPVDGYPNPMQMVLDSYFEQVKTYTIPEALSQFSGDSSLQPNDIVCTISMNNGLLEYTHASRLYVHGGQNRLLGKFGQGPILLTDLSFALRCFPGDAVHVYRYRGPTDTGDAVADVQEN